jgi:hypothetical protein
MSCPPLPREHIGLLAKCLPLLRSPELVSIIADIVCMGALPPEQSERDRLRQVLWKWPNGVRTPCRYRRPGHAWDIERDIADWAYVAFLHAPRELGPGSGRTFRGVEYAVERYQERQQRLNLPQL